MPFLIIILYIGWSEVTGTTRKADGAAYHGKELPTDTAFKIFTTICWSMLGIKGNRDGPGFKRDLIPAQSTFKRVAILSSVIRLLRIGAHPARGLFTYCREVGGVPDGRPQRYTSDIRGPLPPYHIFVAFSSCCNVLAPQDSKTCVWAS